MNFDRESPGSGKEREAEDGKYEVSRILSEAEGSRVIADQTDSTGSPLAVEIVAEMPMLPDKIAA